MPKTPEGKKRSSQNSLKHGMRANNVLILADESEEEYQETRHGWFASYEPEGYHETRLVEQVILNDWLLKRANRRMLETEAQVDAEDYWHRVELMQRYKTTAERAFYRALAAVEGLRKDHRNEWLMQERMLYRYDRKIASLRKEIAKKKAAGEKACRPAAPKSEAEAERHLDGALIAPGVDGSEGVVGRGDAGTGIVAGETGVDTPDLRVVGRIENFKTIRELYRFRKVEVL
jgi:hypothetical protein